MSVAGNVIDEVETKVASVLGGDFRELPRGFDIETIDAHRLENGYKAIFNEGDTASEDIGVEICRVTMTRIITVHVTHRTFSTQVDDKTDTVYRTALDHEQSLILGLRDLGLTTVTGGVRDVVSADIQRFVNDGEHFLRNEIRFTTFYRLL